MTTTSTDRHVPDLVAALRAAPARRGSLRLRGGDRPFTPDPMLRRVGVPRPLVEAIARVATGTVHRIDCGGRFGETWRVSWAPRGTRGKWAGVLDPRQRLFATTATGRDALVGFAMAAIGSAWAMPAVGFDGEWAALLGTLGIEGTTALRPGRIGDVARIVLDALVVDEFAPTCADGACGTARAWRLLVVPDEGELPALDDAPSAVRDALALAPARRGTASILASFGRFAACAERWPRSEPFARGTVLVGEEAEIGARALAQGLHLILEGPSGTGKTTCAREIVAAHHGTSVDVPMSTIALDEVERPEALIGCAAPDGAWVDGPIRRAMFGHDGDGYAIHLTAAEPLTPAMSRLLGSIMRSGSGPIGLAPGAPNTVSGPRFRMVIELSTGDGERGQKPFAGGAGVARIAFERATSHRLAWLLDRLEPDVPRLWRAHAVWVVDDYAIAVANGQLPRVPSVAEVRAWLRLARAQLTNGFESDWVAAMECAAKSTWVPSIAGAEAWWDQRVRYHSDATTRARILACETVTSGDASSGTFAEPGRIGLHSWQQFVEVRTTVDRLTRCVKHDANLVLLANDRPELGGSLGTWEFGSPFCSVAMHPQHAATAEDCLAVVVAVAAHERAHARWSVELPPTARYPGDDAPADVIAASERRKQCIDVLEDMRIERLLDGMQPAHLAPYRLHAARVWSRGCESCLPSEPSRCLLFLAQTLVEEIQTHADAAWDRAATLGRHAGLPADVLDESLELLRAAAAAGEDENVVSALAERLAQLLEQLEHEAGE